MIYGFSTSDENAALGALLVYGVWRSRDPKRFKITPDCWGIVERAAKASAKRARDLYDFIEKLKPKLACSTLHPRWMKTEVETVTMLVNRETGELYSPGGQANRRQFWTEELESADHRAVLGLLYQQTARIIALVRDRLEREKPFEAQFNTMEEEEA
ncbi:MAG: hypothetical protein QME79_12200 [Bacillota bacterium]|nr:hypothetical protein [Bacillota bacterium]